MPPSVQVARPPETHDVSPGPQLLLHVSEQAAVGAVPEHTAEPGHIVVSVTKGQLLASTMHVTTESALAQKVPAPVQSDETHVHEAVPPVIEHIW